MPMGTIYCDTNQEPLRWHVGVTVGASTANSSSTGKSYSRYYYCDDYRYCDRLIKGETAGAFGVEFGYDVAKWFTVVAELNFVQKNYRYDYSTQDLSVHCQSRNNYICLPVLADFNFGKKLRAHLMFGGYVGYWCSSSMRGSRMVVDGTGCPVQENFGDAYVPEEVGGTRFDGGLTFGFGISYDPIPQLRLSLVPLVYFGSTEAFPEGVVAYDRTLRSVGTLRIGAAFRF